MKDIIKFLLIGLGLFGAIQMGGEPVGPVVFPVFTLAQRNAMTHMVTGMTIVCEDHFEIWNGAEWRCFDTHVCSEGTQ